MAKLPSTAPAADCRANPTDSRTRLSSGSVFFTGTPPLGEREQLLGEVLGAPRRFFDVREARVDGLGQAAGDLGEGKVADDQREQVGKIMGDAAREQAERLELVRALAFHGAVALVGDVAKHAEDSDRRTRFVADDVGAHESRDAFPDFGFHLGLTGPGAARPDARVDFRRDGFCRRTTRRPRARR